MDGGGGLARECTGAETSAGLGRTFWQLPGAGFMPWEARREAQSVLLAPHHRDMGLGQPGLCKCFLGALECLCTHSTAWGLIVLLPFYVGLLKEKKNIVVLFCVEAWREFIT